MKKVKLYCQLLPKGVCTPESDYVCLGDFNKNGAVYSCDAYNKQYENIKKYALSFEYRSREFAFKEVSNKTELFVGCFHQLNGQLSACGVPSIDFQIKQLDKNNG